MNRHTTNASAYIAPIHAAYCFHACSASRHEVECAHTSAGTTSVCASEHIKQELARVAVNRAGLVKEIADAVLVGVATGATTTPPVDPQAIAELVADEFAERLKG